MHRFASAFLLPAKTFRREWITVDVQSFKNIKLKWKSAISAMISVPETWGLCRSRKRSHC